MNEHRAKVQSMTLMIKSLVVRGAPIGNDNASKHHWTKGVVKGTSKRVQYVHPMSRNEERKDVEWPYQVNADILGSWAVHHPLNFTNNGTMYPERHWTESKDEKQRNLRGLSRLNGGVGEEFWARQVGHEPEPEIRNLAERLYESDTSIAKESKTAREKRHRSIVKQWRTELDQRRADEWAEYRKAHPLEFLWEASALNGGYRGTRGR